MTISSTLVIVLTSIMSHLKKTCEQNQLLSFPNDAVAFEVSLYLSNWASTTMEQFERTIQKKYSHSCDSMNHLKFRIRVNTWTWSEVEWSVDANHLPSNNSRLYSDVRSKDLMNHSSNRSDEPQASISHYDYRSLISICWSLVLQWSAHPIHCPSWITEW